MPIIIQITCHECGEHALGTNQHEVLGSARLLLVTLAHTQGAIFRAGQPKLPTIMDASFTTGEFNLCHWGSPISWHDFITVGTTDFDNSPGQFIIQYIVPIKY